MSKILQRTQIADAELVLDESLQIGPDLELTRCVLRCTRELAASYCTFNECKFVGIFPKEYYWHGCWFRDCTVTGNLFGHTFGPSIPRHGGGVERCDFSACRMDLCEFFTPGEGIKLPKWPSFRVQGLKAVAERIRMNGNWPKQAPVELARMAFGRDPDWCVYDAATIVQKRKVPLEELRAALVNVEGVSFED